MFAFLTRRKAASDAAGEEAADRDVSANARRTRLFDRFQMSEDLETPLPRQHATRDTFGSKPASE
jgi:hypothetical protein